MICVDVCGSVHSWMRGQWPKDYGSVLSIITLLGVVGKVFCNIHVLNNRLVQCLDKEGVLYEG